MKEYNKIAILTNSGTINAVAIFLFYFFRFKIFHIPTLDQNNNFVKKVLYITKSKPINFELCDNVEFREIVEDPDNIAENVFLFLKYSKEHTEAFSSCFEFVDNLHDKIKFCFKNRISLSIQDTLKILCWIKATEKKYSKIIIIGKCNPFQEIATKVSSLPINYFYPSWLSFLPPLTTIAHSLIFSRTSNPSHPIKRTSRTTAHCGHGGIVFFPHQSPNYGNLYQKNHFYQEKETSPLHPSKILHIEYNIPSKSSLYQETKQYYDKESLPHTFLPSASKKDFIKTAIQFFYTLPMLKTNKNTKKSKNLHIFIFMIFFISSFTKAKRELNLYTPIKIALVGYEALFPKHIWMALQSLQIPTLAIQERINLNYYHPLYTPAIDIYAHGCNNSTDAITKNEPTAIGKKINIGLLKSAYIKLYEDNNKNPYSKIKSNYKNIILALDFHSSKSYAENIYNPLTNWKNNKSFYEDIISLSEEHQNTLFIIRGKNNDWTKIDYFIKTIAKINESKNIIINSDYSVPNVTYMLGAIADLIIAKYTSFGDECLSIGKPVLFHDYGPNIFHIIRKTNNYNGAEIFVRSKDDLHKRVSDFINKNIYLPNGQLKDLQDNFYGTPCTTDSKKYLHQLILETAGFKPQT